MDCSRSSSTALKLSTRAHPSTPTLRTGLLAADNETYSRSVLSHVCPPLLSSNLPALSAAIYIHAPSPRPRAPLSTKTIYTQLGEPATALIPTAQPPEPPPACTSPGQQHTLRKARRSAVPSRPAAPSVLSPSIKQSAATLLPAERPRQLLQSEPEWLTEAHEILFGISPVCAGGQPMRTLSALDMLAVESPPLEIPSLDVLSPLDVGTLPSVLGAPVLAKASLRKVPSAAKYLLGLDIPSYRGREAPQSKALTPASLPCNASVFKHDVPLYDAPANMLLESSEEETCVELERLAHMWCKSGALAPSSLVLSLGAKPPLMFQLEIGAQSSPLMPLLKNQRPLTLSPLMLPLDKQWVSPKQITSKMLSPMIEVLSIKLPASVMPLLGTPLYNASARKGVSLKPLAIYNELSSLSLNVGATTTVPVRVSLKHFSLATRHCTRGSHLRCKHSRHSQAVGDRRWSAHVTCFTYSAHHDEERLSSRDMILGKGSG